MEKSWKRKTRTGGFRRKVLKEYTRIMKISEDDKNDTQENDSCQASSSRIGKGFVPMQYNNDFHQADCTNKKYEQNSSIGEGSVPMQYNNNHHQEGCANENSTYQNIRPESSDEETDEDIDKYKKESLFRDNIRSWAIERNIHQTALKDLIKIINDLNPHILPTDPRTILQTPRHVNIKRIEGGEYWHNGVTNNLTVLLENWPEIPECISLNLNFDGLPIFKSSKNEFWPILCNIYENPNIKPFVIGIYYGIGKPKNLSEFLEDFVSDMCNLLVNGIPLEQLDRIIKVKIRCFICDSPARAFIKGVCNFNGKHGCMKCVTVGEYSHNSHTVTFSDTSCAARTNDGFRNKLYGAHHKIDSPLLNLPIDMIKDFPVGDSLHLIDLGIMKRLLIGWRDGNFGKYLTKWRAADIEIVTIFLNKCDMLPSEIHRAVRTLEYLAYWKASEYRTFLFYLSIIILPDVLTRAVFSHFLKFYCSITICSTERHLALLPLATQLLKYFVIHYKDFYGVDYMTSNVHNLTHVTAEVKRFGPLHSFSAYPFENKLYCIKKLIRGGKNPLAQVAKRIIEATEESKVKDSEKSKKSDYMYLKVKRNNIKILYLQQFKISPKRKDRYVLTSDNEIVEINDIVEVEGVHEIYVYGLKISNKEDVFTHPIKSSHLNIYKTKIQDAARSDIVLSPRNIQCKLVCVDYHKYLYFIPLLHTL